MIMGKYSVEELLHRENAAWNIRDKWRSILQDAYEMAMPFRNPYVSDSKAPKPMDRLFDSTAMTSTFKLANRILMELLPPDDIWFGLKAGPLLEIQLDGKKSQLEEVNKELDKVVKMIALPLQDPTFSSAAVESIIDLLVGGMGCMLALENKKNAVQPVNYQNVSQGEIAIDEGPNGRVEGVFRRRTVKLRMIKRTWPDAVLPDELQRMLKNAKNSDPEIEIREVTYFDDSEGEGHNARSWKYEVIWKGAKKGERLVERGYTTNPWIIWRWFKVPGCPYGPGPVLLSLPDIRTANKVMEMILTNAALALSGVYLVRDDGVLNPNNIMITQGGMIPVASTGGSLGASIAPLESGRGFDVGQFILKDLQAAIRKNLLDYNLPDMEGAVRSATEYIARQREMVQDYGGAVGRLISEAIIPIVRRTADIMIGQGLITPVKIDQYLIKVQVSSPMARAQQFQDSEKVVQWLEILMKFMGQEGLSMGVKLEEFPMWLGSQVGVPKSLIRTEEERMEIEQKIAQAAAAQMQQQAVPNVPQQMAAA